MTIIVNLSSSKLVEVIYGYEFDASGIGETLSIDEELLVCMDGGSMGPGDPYVVVLSVSQWWR